MNGRKAEVAPLMLDTYAAKMCCADLYSSELARLILGDSLHPGGLRATNRLGRAMGLQPGWRVLDLACGLGTSATAISRVFRCHVTGLELGQSAVAESRRRSLEQPVPADVAFVRGDAEAPPFQEGAFDAVLVECATSLFANKSEAMSGVRRLLKPGGVIGISDVTVEPGSLPPELDGTVGMMLCLTEALPADGYRRLLEETGFADVTQQDLSVEVLALLAELRGKLSLGRALTALSGELMADLTMAAPDLLERTQELVERGQIGYQFYVGRRSG